MPQLGFAVLGSRLAEPSEDQKSSDPRLVKNSRRYGIRIISCVCESGGIISQPRGGLGTSWPKFSKDFGKATQIREHDTYEQPCCP